jgi:hypothetical protein
MQAFVGALPQEPKRQSLKECRGLCKDSVEQLGGNRIVSV